MRKEFIMRGQTKDFKTTGATEVLNFSGHEPGYAYRLVEFNLYPSKSLDSTSIEATGSITAGKTALDSENPNFNDEGLIGTALWFNMQGSKFSAAVQSVINDTFLITQNLILMVQDSQSNPVNWQCKFVSVKMTGPEEAATNFKQFSISDE